ncbi:uncharacterized protein LOC133200796 [Saccostrea echinata]|uniref:uncharacterized protein LOC133200796 n=1 Tax=Saccostrea echinata TaxID=191078 RepID=UPI002A7F0CD2|nr:uncharacterized protein LOC133200796 [Saccostrea echinata]
MSLEATIEAKIASKKVIVYSKTYCPFCSKAKKVFDKYLKDGHGTLKADEYEVIEIENDPQCSAIQDYMKKKTGASSVPRVFINGNFIGGGDDVVRKDSSGELKSLLTA